MHASSSFWPFVGFIITTCRRPYEFSGRTVASSLQIIGTCPDVFAAIVSVLFCFTFRNETVSIEKNEAEAVTLSDTAGRAVAIGDLLWG
jgi:hypothetical protein